MSCYKEIMPDRFTSQGFKSSRPRGRWCVSAEGNTLLWTGQAWVHKCFRAEAS